MRMQYLSLKLGRLILAVSVALTTPIYSQGALDDGWYGALGRGFYIPKEDLLTSDLTASGARIFTYLPDNCYVKTDVGIDRKDESFYSTTKSVYSAITTSTNVDLSLKGEYTMGASIRSVTNNMQVKNGQISGNSINLYAETKQASISQNCINENILYSKLLHDLSKLPRKIREPWLDSSWTRYKFFFKKYGSHVVNAVQAGSSIYQYAFAASEHEYTQRNFTVKACASLAGSNDVDELGMSACAGISQNEINSVSKLQIVQKLVVRGGKPETRAKLLNARDRDTIRMFLEEAETNRGSIIYKYVPLWDILQARYIGTKHMAQARNLEEYYKGFLDYGCPYLKTKNGMTLQKFVYAPYSSVKFPSYQCILGPSGCHQDNDCHYKDAFWCACGGESCVKYRDYQTTSGNAKTEASVYNPDTSWWGWQGCRRSGFECFCSAPSSATEIVWRDDSEHVLREAHINAGIAMSLDEAKIRELEERCKIDEEE